MAQLKMYRLASTPFTELTLPEGYSFSLYKEESDGLAWVECCKNGLVGDDATFENFRDSILEHDFTDAKKDCFFLDYKGEHIGTITAVYHPDRNCGEVHMVGMKTEHRGKGLSKYMNNIAVKRLLSDGVDYIYLTTDEWRKGAVKSYLQAGFQPVNYDEGMIPRWEAVLAEYNIDECEMLHEDTTYFCTLHKAK
ncbi:MAG TPA: hypothetical protein DDY98_01345 [Ruminococcaceae bacterium]|nr:hypothetical protein [Oscillospiraceae bacterium]